MSTTVAAAMSPAVAATMSCAAATVAHTMLVTACCRVLTAMRPAFCTDMSRAYRTATHTVSYAGCVVMSQVTVDSVGQGAMIIMPGAVDRPVV